MKIIILVFLIGAIVGIMVLYSHTVARWWVIGVAAVLAVPMRKKIIELVRGVKKWMTSF